MKPVNDINDPSNWLGGRSAEDKVRHVDQRAERGYSVFDFWNFYAYHSWVMVQVLEDFKSGMGHPVYGEVQNMDDWIKVLTKMQKGFKAHAKMANWNGSTKDPEYKKLKKKFRRGMKLFTKYYGSLWD